MTRVTDKISDKQLINIAKQNYESEQTNRRIATEIFDLISEGKVYPEEHPLRSGKIEMRYMTAYDEDILMTQSYVQQGIALNKLLEALIVTPVSLDDIALVDRNGLIVAARILSYGKMYPVTVEAPTGEIIEDEIDLSQLKVQRLDIDSDKNGEFDYTVNDKTKIKFRFPTDIDITEKRSIFLNHAIREVNGSRGYKLCLYLKRVSKKFIRYYVDKLPALLRDWTFEYKTAEGKKETFDARFQFGADLFSWL